MMRVPVVLICVALAACASVPEEPVAVVAAALEAAGEGDLDSVLLHYTPATALDLKRAVSAAEGSGWVPAAPLRLLSRGETVEVYRDGDLAVVEVRIRSGATPVCLSRTDAGWRITLDEALLDGGSWSCRPHRTLYTAFPGGVDDAPEE